MTSEQSLIAEAIESDERWMERNVLIDLPQLTRQVARQKLHALRYMALASLTRPAPSEEPVAWMYVNEAADHRGVVIGSSRPDERASWTPLYTHPQPQLPTFAQGVEAAANVLREEWNRIERYPDIDGHSGMLVGCLVTMEDAVRQLSPADYEALREQSQQESRHE